MWKAGSTLALGAALAGAAPFAAPATAQSTTGRSIMEVIVYGTDPCPRSTDDEIVVCVRRGEEERYRIPERYREGGPRQQREALVNRYRVLESVSATGPQSCSPVGPGGHTGCLEQLIRESEQVRAEDSDSSVPPPQ